MVQFRAIGAVGPVARCAVPGAARHCSAHRRAHSVTTTGCARRSNQQCRAAPGTWEHRSGQPCSLPNTSSTRQRLSPGSRSCFSSARATCRMPDATRPSIGTVSAPLTAAVELAAPRPASPHAHRSIPVQRQVTGHGMSRGLHREARGAPSAAAPDGRRWLSGPTTRPFARECEW